jgi:Rrf2 family iron-sulfur cluster assembly transcriptional regulator
LIYNPNIIVGSMKLTTKTLYGARLLLDLAQRQDEGAIQMSKISIRQNISVKYLEQIIRPLKKAKLVKSIRGPKGGHLLAKKPRKITLGDITRIFEGQSELVGCISETKTCPKSDDCVVRLGWQKATIVFYKELDSISIANLLETKFR